MQFRSRTLSDNPSGHQPEQRPQPGYSDNAKSTLLFAETTTIRTELVTTSTTETAAHLFSSPPARKRAAPPSSLLLLESPDRPSPRLLRDPKSMPSLPLLNKALPPTPPDDVQQPRLRLVDDSVPTTNSSAPRAGSQTESFFVRPRKSSTGLQTAVALAQAALGIGLPHASTSLSKDANVTPFKANASPIPSPMPSPSSVRRVKSSQRMPSRHVSDTHEVANAEQMPGRRNRGLSFTTTSFLNLMGTEGKGKAKEAQPGPSSPKQPAPSLSRKSSFWSRKKNPELDELVVSPTQELTTPSFKIPPVHHLTPLDMSEFSIPSLSSSGASTFASEMINVSSTDSRLSRSYNSSPELYADQIVFPRNSQSRISSDRPATADSSTSARLRTLTNPPLLHRLSMGFFAPSEPSPLLSSRPNSAHHSTVTSPHSFTPKRETRSPIPKPLGENEHPEVYLNRLKSAVGKAEVAGILASSSDSFYSQALRIYIKQFDFHDIPLDVALRKLLMEVGLPRETQQIDRVMEAFAARYVYCNPNIFMSEDHPYILAFSLIMLHTDAFNPSNKRKMSKADYIKNTKLPGVPNEVLDYFFDNIVFAPFIFIEDPVEFNGQSGLNDTIRASTVNTPVSALPSSSGPGPFKIGNKVDPYYLITNNLLEPLRVDVGASVSLDNPFSFEGTNGPWDEQELHEAFLTANVIHVAIPSAQKTIPIFGVGTAGHPQVVSDDPLSNNSAKSEIWNLRITKAGLLNRKDDILEGGKKSPNRKWKPWSVVLTGSQLLFFRDPTWAASLNQNADSAAEHNMDLRNVLRPDESFSLKDAIVVYDRSYTKYKHTMRFVLPDGRQILLQAPNDAELNSWMARINYASAFKSAGIRMRPPGLSGEDVLLTGVAAATSHLHDLQQHFDQRRRKSWDSHIAQDLMGMLAHPNHSKSQLKPTPTSKRTSEFDMDVPVAPEIDGAEQFKATFDQVKADLAASSWSSLDDAPWLSQEEDAENNISESPPTSPGSSISNLSHLPSRSQAIQSKIRHITSRLHASQAQYDADMRYIRNIAILTPFQKSTRARLFTAVQNVAKRINLVRLERERLHCHRHVLACDLASEDRSWVQSKQIALRAAKETLQSKYSHSLPTMTLSFQDDPAGDSCGLTSPRLPTPESTTCESFHSAQEFGSAEDVTFHSFASDLGENEHLRASASVPLLSGQHQRQYMHQKQKQSQEQLQLRSSLNSSLNSASGRASSSFDQVEDQRSESGRCDLTTQIEDEEAEEWNRTKCAQRVSLIHVPSSIMLARLRGC